MVEQQPQAKGTPQDPAHLDLLAAELREHVPVAEATLCHLLQPPWETSTGRPLPPALPGSGTSRSPGL